MCKILALSILLFTVSTIARAEGSGGGGGGSGSGGSRPFFNELSFDGGGAYIAGVGLAPSFGGTFTSGLDFGVFGLAVYFGGLYGPQFTNFTSLSSYGSLDVGLLFQIYTGKVAWRFGCAYVALEYPPGAGGATLYGSGAAPQFGIQYQSSRDYPIYVGFGLDAKALFLAMQPATRLGSTVGLDVTANAFLGFRLTFLEHSIAQRRRW